MTKKRTVLIVDDSRLIRAILIDSLKSNYNYIEAEDGLEAIKLIDTYGKNLSLILLDMVMPHLDGLQVLAYMKKKRLNRLIPVVMVTTEDSEEFISRAYDYGADEVIHKPFNRNIIIKRVKNLIDLYEQKNQLQQLVHMQTRALEEQSKKISHNNDVMIDMLSTVIEYRSLESGQHIRRIRGFTNILLESLSENAPVPPFTRDEILKITAASAMHDIGKIAIPDFVLLKPGRLTTDEFEIMKTHTLKGVDILHNLHGFGDQLYLSYCYDICHYHHERWDGNGYPEGLCRDEIPLCAQAVSVADVYDALTHRRVYKEAFSFSKASSMILNGECGVFSPLLLKCFEQSLTQFEELFLRCIDEAPLDNH